MRSWMRIGVLLGAVTLVLVATVGSAPAASKVEVPAVDRRAVGELRRGPRAELDDDRLGPLSLQPVQPGDRLSDAVGRRGGRDRRRSGQQHAAPRTSAVRRRRTRRRSRSIPTEPAQPDRGGERLPRRAAPHSGLNDGSGWAYDSLRRRHDLEQRPAAGAHARDGRPGELQEDGLRRRPGDRVRAGRHGVLREHRLQPRDASRPASR